MQVPGEVVLQREVGFGPSDRVELVGLVAQPGLAIAGEVIGAGEATAVLRILRLAWHAFGAVVARDRAAADRAGGLLLHLERRVLVELLRDRLLELDGAHLEDVIRRDLLRGDLDVHHRLKLLADLDGHRTSQECGRREL